MRIFVIVLSIALFGLSASYANAECTCRNRETDVTEGKTVCMQTSKGPQLARCEKVLNVTSWRFLGEGCLVAHAPPDAFKQTTALETDKAQCYVLPD
jgi:hypothetical protein